MRLRKVAVLYRVYGYVNPRGTSGLYPMHGEALAPDWCRLLERRSGTRTPSLSMPRMRLPKADHEAFGVEAERIVMKC
ncbi:MAG: hypothetical protein B9J98_05255 [Candidatus Terraquivivens tikiterensis]|uniref:Uncharacterized protein n=1 Tax=Candidatus Terraquivivens tikiterensis TaxID=1980982 RepID=A0A2R7Y2Z9_9ARCH|nr:MAG: hypothetical protein B9J98_05255 [Candidatus Terraquivivens tikiterensis]